MPKEERTTTPYLTKFERARLLGARALQLRFFFQILYISISLLNLILFFSMNAKSTVNTYDLTDPLLIAERVLYYIFIFINDILCIFICLFVFERNCKKEKFQ